MQAFRKYGTTTARAQGVAPDSPLRPEMHDIPRLGRRYLRRILQAAREDDLETPGTLINSHLGPGAVDFPILTERWPQYDLVNVYAGLESWLCGERTHVVHGIAGFEHHAIDLSSLIQGGRAPFGPTLGGLPMVNLAVGPGGQTRPVLQCGLYLVTEGEDRLAILFLGDSSDMPGRSGVVVQVAGTKEDVSAAALSKIKRLALERNVYRGHVLSFGSEMFDNDSSPLIFHERENLGREGLILPPGVLESIERHVVGVREQAARLQASGQHLKRGLLLHGPPGTGKTHTVRYLTGRLTGLTIIILSGSSLGAIAPAASIARSLQPSMVVIEDVDLIAKDRGYGSSQPLLFELLNEMDGLGEDVDVTFLLTTNRPDLLEPALAARPGRVDLAVEIGLPDAAGRMQLFELYSRKMTSSDVDREKVAERTEGMTASFIKELIRRATLIAAEASPGEQGAVTVTDDQAQRALNELLDTRSAMTRTLLGVTDSRRRHRGADWMETPDSYPT